MRRLSLKFPSFRSTFDALVSIRKSEYLCLETVNLWVYCSIFPLKIITLQLKVTDLVAHTCVIPEDRFIRGFNALLCFFRSKELQSEAVDLRERIKHLNDMVFCQQRKVKGMIEEVSRVYLHVHSHSGRGYNACMSWDSPSLFTTCRTDELSAHTVHKTWYDLMLIQGVALS